MTTPRPRHRGLTPAGDEMIAQRKYEQRQIASGARRLPGGLLPPEAARALDTLRARGYAGSLIGCIARALVETATRRK